LAFESDVPLAADFHQHVGGQVFRLAEGDWPVSYKPKFCSLREAVMLIANHLANADREHYADPAATLRDARAQLLQARFEGAVRSEGVSYEVGPQEYGPAFD
jgi:hypothetical protein